MGEVKNRERVDSESDRPWVQVFRNIRWFLQGSFSHQLYGISHKDLAEQEDTFMLLLFGDLLGIPVSGYLQLKLLPHFLPMLDQWQQRVTRDESKFWKEMEKLVREF